MAVDNLGVLYNVINDGKNWDLQMALASLGNPGRRDQPWIDHAPARKMYMRRRRHGVINDASTMAGESFLGGVNVNALCGVVTSNTMSGFQCSIYGGRFCECAFAMPRWRMCRVLRTPSALAAASAVTVFTARPKLCCDAVRSQSSSSSRAAPSVAIIATGGTIDKTYPRVTGGWAFEIGEPSATRILERVTPPGFDFSVTSVCAKDSQEITDSDRAAILAACASAAADRIVVTHGTDTLVETALYLGQRHAQHLQGKRICVTGSMRPERFVDSDAHFNMGICFGALSLAEPGVYVCMNGAVHPWDRVRRDLQTGLFVADFQSS